MAIQYNDEKYKESLYYLDLYNKGMTASGRKIEETLSVPKPKNALEEYGKYIDQYQSMMSGGQYDLKTLQKARDTGYLARYYLRTNQNQIDADRGAGSAQGLMEYINRSQGDIERFSARTQTAESSKLMAEYRQMLEDRRERETRAATRRNEALWERRATGALPTGYASLRGAGAAMPTEDPKAPEQTANSQSPIKDYADLLEEARKNSFPTVESFVKHLEYTRGTSGAEGAQLQADARTPERRLEEYDAFWNDVNRQRGSSFAANDPRRIAEGVYDATIGSMIGEYQNQYGDNPGAGAWEAVKGALAQGVGGLSDLALMPFDYINRGIGWAGEKLGADIRNPYADLRSANQETLGRILTPLREKGTVFENIIADAGGSAIQSAGTMLVGGGIGGQAAKAMGGGLNAINTVARTNLIEGVTRIAQMSPFGMQSAAEALEDAQASGLTDAQSVASAIFAFGMSIATNSPTYDKFMERLGIGAQSNQKLFSALTASRFGSLGEAGIRFVKDALNQGLGEGLQEVSESLTLKLNKDMWKGTFFSEEGWKEWGDEAKAEFLLGALQGTLFYVSAMPSYAPSVNMMRQMVSGEVETNAETLTDLIAQSVNDSENPQIHAEMERTVAEASAAEATTAEDAAAEWESGASAVMDEAETERQRGMLEEHARGLDPDAAQALVDSYDGSVLANEHYGDFVSTVNAAEKGASVEDVATQSRMSQGATVAAFSAGRKAAQETQVRASNDAQQDETASGNVKYSIKTLPDGKPYVQVDTDQHLFDGLNVDESRKVARKYILNHFRGKAIGEGPARSYVDGRGTNEYAYSANQRIGNDVKNAKFRAALELDNLLTASEFVEHKIDDGHHPEAIGGWDYYKTTFEVGGRRFEGTVSVYDNGRGKVFHDVTKIKETAIRTIDQLGAGPSAESDGDLTAARAGNERSSISRVSQAATDDGSSSISETAPNSNTQNTPDDGTRPGVHRQYTDTAMKRLGGKEQQSAARAQLRALDGMAKRYGFTVDVVDRIPGDRNAQYDPATRKITIALDAQEGAYLHMATHELVHYIRDASGPEWEIFSDLVTDALVVQGVNVDALVRYQMEKNGLSADRALEEVVANSVPAILSDEATVKRIIRADRGLAQRIADFLFDFLEKLREIGEKLSRQSKSWAQMGWLQNDATALQEISDRFFAALESSGEISSGDETSDVLMSERKYSTKDDAEIDAAILRRFGRTYSWKETGYVLKDGTRVDFSGKNDGGPGGYRAVDHREVYGEHTQEYIGEIDGYSDGMVDYMARGNIRISPESNGINLSVQPTVKQESALRSYIENARGEVLVDFDTLDGDTVESIEYPRGTRPEKVISDIRGYFAEGTKPTVSDIARIRAIPENTMLYPQTRFSTKDLTTSDVDAIVKENEGYRNTIDLMQERYELLKKEFKATEGAPVREKDIRLLAGRILRQTGSKADGADAAQGLKTVFDAIASDTPQWNEIAALGTSWAKGVLEQSRAMDAEAYEAAAELRIALKGLTISLSDTQKAEAKSILGSPRDYLNGLFGYVNVTTKGGTPLSSVWSELAERFPHVFDADMAEGDMPIRLLEAVDIVRPSVINPYGMNMDEAAFDLFMQVYDRYFELPQVKTYADRQKAKLDLLRMESRNAIARIREQTAARYDRQLRALRHENVQKRQELAKKYSEAKDANRKAEAAKYRARYRALTDRKNMQLAEQRARFSEWRSMDSARRKEREGVRKYRARIEKNVKELATWLASPTDKTHVLESLRESIGSFLGHLNFDGTTKRSESMKLRLESMAGKLSQIANNETEDVYMEIDPDAAVILENLAGQMRSTQSVYDMNAAQLKELSDAVSAIRHAVITANKLHAQNRYATVSAAGDAAIGQLKSMRDIRAEKGLGGIANRLLNESMLDSFAYFERFGDPGKALLESLRSGFDRKVLHVRDAQKYVQGVKNEMDLKKLSGAKARKHTFKLGGGTLEMTGAQIMELYALNKREQARGHIYGGGISLEDKNANVVKLTAADVAQITGALTDAEKKLADALQGYLSKEVAEWGNEASLEMYGYRKFTEPNYYPIRSNDNDTMTKDNGSDNGSLYRLRNMGMTKATVKGANNPIVVGDIFDTFSRHIEEMANYNAYAAASGDVMRWYNYKHRDAINGAVDTTVKREIERVFGAAGKTWLTSFVKALNGSTEGNYMDAELANKMLRNAKVAAVGANLRTVIQQPTAYARAFAEIDAKYLLKGLAGKPNVALAKKYSPIALWKSWGYYETGLGKSMRETIVGDQGLVDSVRAKSTGLAGLADELTWGYLWNAVAAETRAKRPELRRGSEAFNQAVGKRLSEVIDSTQVVDTVFHRSQIMRSKNGIVQLATAFMSEPTKTYNMLRTAIADVARNPGDKAARAKLGRSVVTFAFTGVLTAAAASLMDAWRDDDDEKEWWEKYKEALGANAVDNLNPMQLIPYLRDVMSLFDGYQPGRMDMQGVTRAVNVAKQIGKLLQGDSKWSAYKTVYEAARAISDLTGVPVGSAMRELNAAWNAITGKPIPMEHETASFEKAAKNYYASVLVGDTAGADRIREKLRSDPDSPKNNSDIDRAVGRVLAETDERIPPIWEAKAAGDIAGLNRMRRELVSGGYTNEMVDVAVNAYGDSLAEKKDKDMTKEADERLYNAKYAAGIARKAAASGRYTDLDLVIKEMIADSEAKEPEKYVRENIRGELKPEYIAAYEAGDYRKAEQLGAVLVSRLGMKEDDLDDWVWQDRRSRLMEAIEDMDDGTIFEIIDEMTLDGKEEYEIAESLSQTYKARAKTLWEAGDSVGVDEIVSLLTGLPLRNKERKPYFSRYLRDDWIKGWEKSEREALKKAK